MLTELCGYLKNWFDRARFFGTFEIKNGRLLSFNDGGIIQDGQHFRIIGSVFNDGVYQYDSNDPEELQDETFSGAVWLLAIPQEVQDLSAEIDAWREKNEALDSAAMSPYNSESFGGYSYSKSSGITADGNGIGGWQTAFGNRLARWRKI